MSQLKVNSIVDASGGSNAVLYGPASPAGSMGFRNRIINGAMVIAQRGTSYTPSTSGNYGCVDRWNVRAASGGSPTASQSSTAPSGFKNSLLFTTGTGVSPAAGDRNWLRQNVEGYNIDDLAWGTADAKTITVSFWVRSSLTGTFAAAVVNNNGDQAWPFTYTISSANTFEYKTTTITGSTSGTWGPSNDVGLALTFDMGCGSNYEGTAGQWNGSNKLTVSGATKVIATTGATFYITGVQLEVGSVATEFERRPYGTELSLCQRYFQTWGGTNNYEQVPFFGIGYNSTTIEGTFTFIQTMRTNPTLSVAGSWAFSDVAALSGTGTLILDNSGIQSARLRSTSSSGLTGYRPYVLLANNSTAARLQLSAEL